MSKLNLKSGLLFTTHLALVGVLATLVGLVFYGNRSVFNQQSTAYAAIEADIKTQLASLESDLIRQGRPIDPITKILGSGTASLTDELRAFFFKLEEDQTPMRDMKAFFDEAGKHYDIADQKLLHGLTAYNAGDHTTAKTDLVTAEIEIKMMRDNLALGISKYPEVIRVSYTLFISDAARAPIGWVSGLISFLVPISDFAIHYAANPDNTLSSEVQKLVVAELLQVISSQASEYLVEDSVNKAVGHSFIWKNLGDAQKKKMKQEIMRRIAEDSNVLVDEALIDPVKTYVENVINGALDSQRASAVQEQKSGGFFSSFLQVIAKPFKFLWNKAVSLFTKNDTNPELPAKVGDAVENIVQDNNAPQPQWETIDKPTFTIKTPESWKETVPQFGFNLDQGVRFEGSTGEYFQVTIDPPAVGLPATDEHWELGVNASGDGVVIKSIDGEGFPGKGNNKLEINAFAYDSDDQNILLQRHAYFFFFGNNQKEVGVDTEVFRAILNSFRTKRATGQKQATPPIVTLDKSTAEKVILQALKADYAHWPTTPVHYDDGRGGYYDIWSRLRNFSGELENLGLVTIVGSDPLTLLVEFTTKAESYIVKDQSGKAQGVVEALPEKVGVTEISTNGWGIGYYCSGNCYIVTYTATYAQTPFGQYFKSASFSRDFQESVRVSPIDDCWEVNPSLVHTSKPKKICL